MRSHRAAQDTTAAIADIRVFRIRRAARRRVARDAGTPSSRPVPPAAPGPAAAPPGLTSAKHRHRGRVVGCPTHPPHPASPPSRRTPLIEAGLSGHLLKALQEPLPADASDPSSREAATAGYRLYQANFRIARPGSLHVSQRPRKMAGRARRAVSASACRHAPAPRARLSSRLAKPAPGHRAARPKNRPSPINVRDDPEWPGRGRLLAIIAARWVLEGSTPGSAARHAP